MRDGSAAFDFEEADINMRLEDDLSHPYLLSFSKGNVVNFSRKSCGVINYLIMGAFFR